jgi:hypothetical protein
LPVHPRAKALGFLGTIFINRELVLKEKVAVTTESLSFQGGDRKA